MMAHRPVGLIVIGVAEVDPIECPHKRVALIDRIDGQATTGTLRFIRFQFDYRRPEHNGGDVCEVIDLCSQTALLHLRSGTGVVGGCHCAILS